MPVIRLLISVLLVGSLTGQAFSAEVWKIASLDWEPYSDSKVASQGTAIAQLRDVLKLGGIELVVEFYPWDRAKQRASQKDFVGYFPSWHEAVIDGFVASPAVGWSGIGIMTYKGSGLAWSGMEALFAKHTVGLVPSYIYPKEIREAAERYPGNVDYTPNELSLVKKLAGKRIQAAISGPEVMQYIAGQYGLNNLTLLHSLGQKELVVAFRNEADNWERMAVFERLIARYYADSNGIPPRLIYQPDEGLGEVPSEVSSEVSSEVPGEVSVGMDEEPTGPAVSVPEMLPTAEKTPTGLTQ